MVLHHLTSLLMSWPAVTRLIKNGPWNRLDNPCSLSRYTWLSSITTTIFYGIYTDYRKLGRKAYFNFTSPHGLTFTWWGCWGLCVWYKPTELAHSFYFSSCVYFCLYNPFDCISCYNFSRQLSAFSFYSSSLISALLVLPTIISPYETLLQPWYNSLWLTGLKAPSNSLTISQNFLVVYLINITDPSGGSIYRIQSHSTRRSTTTTPKILTFPAISFSWTKNQTTLVKPTGAPKKKKKV